MGDSLTSDLREQATKVSVQSRSQKHAEVSSAKPPSSSIRTEEVVNGKANSYRHKGPQSGNSGQTNARYGVFNQVAPETKGALSGRETSYDEALGMKEGEHSTSKLQYLLDLVFEPNFTRERYKPHTNPYPRIGYLESCFPADSTFWGIHYTIENDEDAKPTVHMALIDKEAAEHLLIGLRIKIDYFKPEKSCWLKILDFEK